MRLLLFRYSQFSFNEKQHLVAAREGAAGAMSFDCAQLLINNRDLFGIGSEQLMNVLTETVFSLNGGDLQSCVAILKQRQQLSGMLLNVVPCAKERTFTNTMVTGQHDGRKASDMIEKPGKAGSKQ